ncbi:ATP-grasp domain-containing protein [Actinomadura litoris]|uniref:ATP-grasp domain-containing protein n=1 Tax=Actinomadura litoris TaxID=2678616 RepID=UPI001FA7CFE9|nr:ATP-grasp domain-containing protein [Actinomadura litoris]
MAAANRTPTPNRPTAVLVDAYSTGNFLPPAFDRLGVDVVHVRSTPEPIAGMLAPDLGAYRSSLVCGDPAATAARLAALDPIAVGAGQEPGVPLADELSERLGLPTNGTALSAARRDKFEMIEALRRAGVRCADQVRASDAADAVAWAERRGAYPVVVKPLASSGTDGVEICADAGQVRDAAEAVLGSRTVYGEPNTAVLVQSYLAGTEYVVDMVCCRGARYTCGIWRSQKRLLGTRNTYDLELLVAPEEDVVADLIAYVGGALDALGIDHGPAHAEVIVTERGPTLIEVGARLAGHLDPGFHDECLGGNQADLTALAYTSPETFLRERAGRRYTRRLAAGVYASPTEQDGVVERIDWTVVKEIENLPGVYGVLLKLREGDRIRPTVDLRTSTMRVYLRAGTEEAMARDYRLVRELKDRVFQVG